MSDDSRRSYREHQALQRVERVLGLLDLEIRLGTTRRHLDVLLELAALALDQCVQTQLVAAYRDQLADATERVLTRCTPPPRQSAPASRPSSPPSLRLIKS